MAFVIQSGDVRIEFSKSIVLGRSKYFKDPTLSRRHVKIISQGKQIFIKDLGSHNGTLVNGKSIGSEPVEIFPEDKVMIGFTVFSCLYEASTEGARNSKYNSKLNFNWIFAWLFGAINSWISKNSKPRTKMDLDLNLKREFWHVHVAGIFVFLSLLTLLEPTLAFGRSIGFFYLCFVLGSVALATALGYGIWAWILRGSTSFWRKTLVFTLLVIASSATINTLFAIYANKEWSIGQKMITAKIHYFCVANFDQPRCVEQVTYCPSCVVRIDKWERAAAVENLKAFRAKYPPAALAKLKEIEQRRQPAANRPSSQ